MNKTRATIVLLFIILIAGAGAIFWTQRPADKGVVVAQFGDLLLYLPLYIADDEGLFKKEGLTVKIISTGGDDKTFAAVLSGDADFGVADPTFAAIAKTRGGDGSVIALLINGMPNYGVSQNPSAKPITDLSQLRGQRFASVPAPSTAYAALADLYRRGGSEPNILQTAPAGLFAAAKEPDVAGAVLIEPWVSQIESQGGRVVLSMPAFYREFALTGVTTSDALRRSHPETIAKVRKALQEGVRLLYDDPELAFQVAKRRFPSESPDSLRRGIQRMRADGVYARDLRVTRASWNAAIELRIRGGDYRGTSDESWAVVASEAR